MNRHTILNKKVTLMLHGIAILMMIYHHIFQYGNTWYVDNPTSLFDYLNAINMGRAYTYQQTFAWFCRICVAIFAFTSGYGIYIQYEKQGIIDFKLMYKNAFNRLLKFYKKYLLMFIVFISLEIYTNCISVVNYTILDFVASGLGLSYVFNFTWWYVSEYYLLLLVSPIIYWVLHIFKFKHYLYIIVLFIIGCVISFVLGNLIPYLKFFSYIIQTQVVMFLVIFMEGMFVAHFNLVDIIANKINNIVAILILIIVYIARVLLVRDAPDSLFDLVLITPFIIACSKLFSSIKLKYSLLSFFGKYSTYMWFVHAYFYAIMFFRLVIKSNYSLLVYVQTVYLSLFTALLLTLLEKGIDKLILKLKAKN